MIEGCPDPRAECPYATTGRGCYADKHHLAYPKKHYKKQLEREYRNLPELKIQLCRWAHDVLHLVEPLPLKPTSSEMQAAIAENYVIQSQQHED